MALSNSKRKNGGRHPPEVVWRSVWPSDSEIQGERSSALTVLASAAGGSLLLLLLDELAGAVAAVDGGREGPADDLVVEGSCSTMSAPAFVGIGTFGPRDMAEDNQGVRSMVGRSPR